MNLYVVEERSGNRFEYTHVCTTHLSAETKARQLQSQGKTQHARVIEVYSRKDSDIVNLRSMARMLGVTQQWLRKYADSGAIPSLNTGHYRSGYLFSVSLTLKCIGKLLMNK